MCISLPRQSFLRSLAGFSQHAVHRFRCVARQPETLSPCFVGSYNKNRCSVLEIDYSLGVRFVAPTPFPSRVHSREQQVSCITSCSKQSRRVKE